MQNHRDKSDVLGQILKNVSKRLVRHIESPATFFLFMITDKPRVTESVTDGKIFLVRKKNDGRIPIYKPIY
jgi:hypothetical protein